VASDYFLLRGFDAQTAIYQQSIDLYKNTLDLVKAQFAGVIASALDVARVESLYYSTQTKLAQVQAQRQVTEQAIAILVNMAPASFTIDPINELGSPALRFPGVIPATVLDRRPDIAGSERRMAQASRVIGVARAAFSPTSRSGRIAASKTASI
jgi:outer membrane protein TolC